MNYLCKLSYKGTNYNGFQRLKNASSIQAEVERALGQLTGEEVKIKAAGRTDAGVHALGQRFNFHMEKKIEDRESFRKIFNRLLPNDIRIIFLEEVEEKFHARLWAKKKIYSYRFSWGEKDPIKSDLIAQIGYFDLDLDAMRKSLAYFVGEHDFRNFTTKKDDVDDFVREIDEIKFEVNEEDKLGEATFIGNGFMTYQIRLIMGLAIKIAKGQEVLENVPKLLEARPRHIVSYKAPAEGLYLMDVLYE